MITGSELYWILMLDGIIIFLGFLIFIGVVCAIIFLRILFTIDDDKTGYYSVIGLIVAVIWSFVLSTALVLTPSTKQMAMIKVVPMIANSEIMQELPGDAKELYRLGVDAAKGYLEDKAK